MGPNGAGKSTFRKNIMPHLSGMGNIEQINLDDYATKIAQTSTEHLTADELYQKAATMKAQTMDQCISNGNSFVVESVYSNGGLGTQATSYTNLHRQGWKLGAILIGLSSLEQSEKRVEDRVSQGGHGTGLIDLQSNWDCSVLGAKNLLENCDFAYIYDNSEDIFQLIAKKDGQKFSFNSQPQPTTQYPAESYTAEIIDFIKHHNAPHSQTHSL